ncbi:MAG TPA: trigger factor [Woeseiaceae bacterium]|nr:trigger factor [Woeseiaceae bacterium]
MNVTVESTGTLERRMRVELPAERIEKEVETRLKSVGRTVKIKGFRPGKVPATVVRQRYGVQVRQEVLTDLMGQSYRDAVAQENLNPVARPKIEPVVAKDGKGFAFVATFEVLPEVRLKNLGKIKVTRPDVEISEQDCDDMLQSLRQQKATWKAVDRKSKDGDRVTVDFDGTLKGEPVKGGKGSKVPVVLGRGQMLPEFEKGLAGIAAGDESTFTVKFPKDYHVADLASKKVEFAVKVHLVEEPELPPLDDSLAEQYGVTEGGLAQLRKDVRSNMEREARQKVTADVKLQVLNTLLELNPLEVPQALKHEEMHNMQHEAMRRMGIEDPEHKHDRGPPMSDFAEAAEKRVRLGLLVNQVIADQQIVVDPARVRQRVEDICSGYEDADKMVASYLGNPQIMASIEPLVLEEQAIDWLIANGEEKVNKVPFKEYMKP